MLIIEWTTVTFGSASLLINKYREGGSLQWNVLHFTTMVSVYTQIQFWNSICSNHKKKVVSKKRKTIKKKGIFVRGRLFCCLSKIPDTVCLRATALCAVQALAVYDRFLRMSSTFSHLQKTRCQRSCGNDGVKNWLSQNRTILQDTCETSVTRINRHYTAVQKFNSKEENQPTS